MAQPSLRRRMRTNGRAMRTSPPQHCRQSSMVHGSSRVWHGGFGHALPLGVQGQGVALGRVRYIGARLVGRARAVRLRVPAGERVALAQEDAGLGGRGRGAGVAGLPERVAVSAVRVVSDGGLASADGRVKGLRGQGRRLVGGFGGLRLDLDAVRNGFVGEMDLHSELCVLPDMTGLRQQFQCGSIAFILDLQAVLLSGQAGAVIACDRKGPVGKRPDGVMSRLQIRPCLGERGHIRIRVLGKIIRIVAGVIGGTWRVLVVRGLNPVAFCPKIVSHHPARFGRDMKPCDLIIRSDAGCVSVLGKSGHRLAILHIQIQVDQRVGYFRVGRAAVPRAWIRDVFPVEERDRMTVANHPR